MNYPNHDPFEWIDHELAQLAERGLRRTLRTHDGPQGLRLNVAGRELINFGSNDYLGLAAEGRLCAAAARAVEQAGCGAGASPLVSGHSASHRRLEDRLAEFERTEAALVFSSGYAANVGTIPALAGRGDAIYADQNNHASMIDGCRLSRAEVHVYPHADCGTLERQLQTSSAYRRRLIVSESVFSMDGDLAPLAELVALAERFDCMLLVDEAHATGVFGHSGRGVSEALGVEHRIGIRMGTLSKALGCAGGFVCGSKSLVEWLINQARSYVFSTALPPAVCAAALVAIDLVRQEPQRRAGLLETAQGLRVGLREQGWNIGASESQIVPIIVGTADRAVRLSARLFEQGILVPAIRPPAVPADHSLLRISLNCGHTPAIVERLLAALAALRVEVADHKLKVPLGPDCDGCDRGI
jgi:8-amino-7-oxononanoate synthase